MQEMSEGITVDQQTLIMVLQNKLAQASLKEAQLEAAVQGLIIENQTLKSLVPKTEVVEDASSEG